MHKQHEQLLHTSDRVEEFLRSNPDRLTHVITSAAHQNFDGHRVRLDGFCAVKGVQTMHAKSQVVTTQALRQQLVVEHMRPIAAVARAQLAGAGELAPLTMPTQTNRYGALIGAATSMAEAARVHEAKLLEGGLQRDFLAKLVAATDALRSSLSARGQTIALRVEATAGARKESTALRKTLRVLDTMVRAAVRNDELLLDRWRSISRVASTAVSSASSGKSTGSSSSPAPAPAVPVDTTVNPAPLTIPIQSGSPIGSTINEEVRAAA